MPQELPGWQTRLIDITSDTEVDALLAELDAPGGPVEVVALRGGQRWVETVAKIELPPVADPREVLRRGGCYLITGGLGGLGLALAEFLTTELDARVALASRTGLPDRARWPELLVQAGANEDEQAHRIRAVQALQARGAAVEILTADVGDPDQADQLVQDTRARLGAVHGVFHAAGLPGVGLIARKIPEAARQVLAPKVYGTNNLIHSLHTHAPEAELLVLYSSVTSATGGPGQADYCTANAYLEAVATHHQQHLDQSLRITTISWGEWQWDAWHDGLQGFLPEVSQALIQHRHQYGIHTQEGLDALKRHLHSHLPHTYATTENLAQAITDSKNATATRALEHLREQRAKQPHHPRPDLNSNYIEPRTPLENQIATTWQQVLGISPIGIHDNFFELGGNSLLGIGLIDQLRKETKRNRLPLHVLYDAPTVAALAQQLDGGAPMVVLSDLEEDSARRRRGLDQFRMRAERIGYE